MTTLAADKNRTYAVHGNEFDTDLPVIASDIIYLGAAVGENGSGYFRPLVAADPFAGFALMRCDNASGAAGAKNVHVRSKGVAVLSVTGVTAVTDEGSTVYASDDDTFTLTSTSNTAIGKVVRYISGTQVEVAFESVSLRSI
jgi:hypothetical protein